MSTIDRDTRSPGRRAAFTAREREAVDGLFAEYTRTRDLQLRNRLVLQHSALARGIAARFGPSAGHSQQDLQQVGYLGLIAAVERYDPASGVSFRTFAAATIVGVIKHHLRDYGWLLKAPRRLREAGIRLHKLRALLETKLSRVPTIPELAAAADMDEEEVLLAMELQRNRHPTSLDSQLQNELGDESGSLWDTLGDLDPRYATIEEREAVRRIISHLDAREQHIIRERFYAEASQAEVAEQLQISQMHVSRLERRALRRLKSLFAQREPTVPSSLY
jgi:RNA polymerase sigma-B factor